MKLAASALGAALALAAALAACDPVHGDVVDSLGDEAPGVPRGPLHRPGQPCGYCHDGAIGNPQQFSVAGTVFMNANDRTAAISAAVKLTGSDGTSFTATTNAAGNFYVQPREYTPVYPMHVVVSYQGVTVQMTSHVGRDGSCADCHFDPVGPASAGHVYIPADGGTP